MNESIDAFDEDFAQSKSDEEDDNFTVKQPAAKPADKPVEKPAEKPVEKPDEKPADKPAPLSKPDPFAAKPLEPAKKLGSLGGSLGGLPSLGKPSLSSDLPPLGGGSALSKPKSVTPPPEPEQKPVADADDYDDYNESFQSEPDMGSDIDDLDLDDIEKENGDDDYYTATSKPATKADELAEETTDDYEKLEAIDKKLAEWEEKKKASRPPTAAGTTAAKKTAKPKSDDDDYDDDYDDDNYDDDVHDDLEDDVDFEDDIVDDDDDEDSAYMAKPKTAAEKNSSKNDKDNDNDEGPYSADASVGDEFEDQFDYVEKVQPTRT